MKTQRFANISNAALVAFAPSNYALKILNR